MTATCSGTVSYMPTADSQPVVTIIVVSFNTRDMTLECLRSVLDETSVPFELIVVDNASTDGSAEAVAAEFPEVRLFAETDNHGFGRANNLAAEHAHGDYILLLNPDTVVLDGAVDRLISFARQRPEAGIWGGRTIHADGSLNSTSCYQKMTLWTLFCRAVGLAPLLRNHPLVSERFGSWQMDSVRQVDIITGCFLLIDRELWSALNGFDPIFFMYGEEADLCLRAARQRDARPLFTPDAEIIHHGGASEHVRADRDVRLFAAKMTLVRRHFPAWAVPLGRVLLALIPFTRAVALSVLAALGRHEARGLSGLTWSEVWTRRGEWVDGF